MKRIWAVDAPDLKDKTDFCEKTRECSLIGMTEEDGKQFVSISVSTLFMNAVLSRASRTHVLCRIMLDEDRSRGVQGSRPRTDTNHGIRLRWMVLKPDN
ncbi:hypothetical protein HDF16_005248 [Granulicella aggregans]|uniref:Uncharacterized protein n=1 Tax=Granulicella aggregans TaxID=474949 RepID=A0A7W8E6B5_9BACT|nr:hypothetical protein [Granulicella aggregans]